MTEWHDRGSLSDDAATISIDRLKGALGALMAAMSRLPFACQQSRAAVIRQYLRARRLRQSFLPDELFQESGWDLLLELYACAEEGKILSFSDACIAAGASAAATSRSLKKLERLELVTSVDEDDDNKSAGFRLTERGQTAIGRWVEFVLSGS